MHETYLQFQIIWSTKDIDFLNTNNQQKVFLKNIIEPQCFPALSDDANTLDPIMNYIGIANCGPRHINHGVIIS